MIILVILGIDPGYAIVGYGAIHFYNNKYIPIGYGSIFTKSDQEFCDRLNKIYDNMKTILLKSNPDALAIEKLYFQNNQKTAICVAEARGVILLAAKRYNIPIFEYTPLQVKIAVTGYGQAAKPQVMDMTKRLLNLKEMPKPDDTADALAIAICHANSSGFRLRQNIIKKGFKN